LVATDKRYDTFMQMQTTANSSWSIALPNQWYKVSVGCGDPNYTDSYDKIDANGVTVIDFTPTTANHFGAGTAYTHVTTGSLVVKPSTGATGAKIDFIHISPVSDGEALGTGVNDVQKKKMKAYVQNGNLNILNLENPKNSIQLFNSAGQLLITKTNLPQNATVSVQNLAKGIYILEMKSGDENLKIKVEL